MPELSTFSSRGGFPGTRVGHTASTVLSRREEIGGVNNFLPEVRSADSQHDLAYDLTAFEEIVGLGNL